MVEVKEKGGGSKWKKMGIKSRDAEVSRRFSERSDRHSTVNGSRGDIAELVLFSTQRTKSVVSVTMLDATKYQRLIEQGRLD